MIVYSKNYFDVRLSIDLVMTSSMDVLLIA